MKNTLIRIAPLLVGASFLLPAVARGQNAQPVRPPATPVPAIGIPGNPPPAAVAPAAPPHAVPLAVPVRLGEATEHTRVELKLEGVPLLDVVKLMEKEFSEINFVMNERLAELNPGITLRMRAAGLRDILEAISIATDGQVVSEVRSPTLVALRGRPEPVAIPPAAPGADPFRGLPGGPAQPEPGGPVQRSGGSVGGGGGLAGGPGAGFGVAVTTQPAPAPAPSPLPTTYQVLNLRDILRVHDSNRIKEALVTAQSITTQTLKTLAGNSTELAERLRLRSFDYHEGSGVLVIIGQPEAIKVAMEVIRSLRLHDSATGPQNPPSEKPAEPK